MSAEEKERAACVRGIPRESLWRGIAVHGDVEKFCVHVRHRGETPTLQQAIESKLCWLIALKLDLHDAYIDRAHYKSFAEKQNTMHVRGHCVWYGVPRAVK